MHARGTNVTLAHSCSAIIPAPLARLVRWAVGFVVPVVEVLAVSTAVKD